MARFFTSCHAPLYRIETATLVDESLGNETHQNRTTLFADVPTTGRAAIAASGDIYVSDTDRNRILKVSPQGEISALIEHKRQRWTSMDFGGAA